MYNLYIYRTAKAKPELSYVRAVWNEVTTVSSPHRLAQSTVTSLYYQLYAFHLAPTPKQPQCLSIVDALREARRRIDETEDMAWQLGMGDQKGARCIHDIVLGNQLPGHPLQAHGIHDQRYVICTDGYAMVTDEPQRLAQDNSQINPMAIPEAVHTKAARHRFDEGMPTWW